MAAGRLYGYAADGYWLDAGTPERYLQLQRDLLRGVAQTALPITTTAAWPGLVVGAPPSSPDERPVLASGATLTGAVVLGPGVRVGVDARLQGPLTVGARGAIAAEAVVDDSLLWDGCSVGDAARVSGSVLASGCRVGDGAVVERSVLGEGVVVRAGAQLKAVVADPGAVLG